MRKIGHTGFGYDKVWDRANPVIKPGIMVVRAYSILIFIAFFVLAAQGTAPAAVVAPPGAGTNVVPGTACDQDFLDVIESRAWMEGKREMEIAQHIILKPDSVLEYSCFNQRLVELGSAYTSINLNNSLDVLVRDSLTNYFNRNFGHVLAGGYFDVTAGGTCNAMFQVWNFLKCRDFSDDDDDDGVPDDDFLTFAELAASDPRVVSSYTALNCNEPGRAAKWNAALAAAFPPPSLPAASGGMDATQTFLGILDPADCSASLAVPTGVITHYEKGNTTHPDAVCTAPGCFYDGTGGCQ